jgi:hypothetical protein
MPTTSGTLETLETPVAGITSTAVVTAATAETSATAGALGTSTVVRTTTAVATLATSTVGPKATQETTGIAVDAKKGRQLQWRNNIGENTSTAGPTATQETTGTAGSLETLESTAAVSSSTAVVTAATAET